MLQQSQAWVDELAEIARCDGVQSASPGEAGWDACREVVRLDRSGDREEATWLAFLCTLLGERNEDDSWAYVGHLYAGLGSADRLTWHSVSNDPLALDDLVSRDPVRIRTLRFGNHRKYESQPSIPDVVRSYVSAVRARGGSQAGWFGTGDDGPGRRFSRLLPDVEQQIHRFGRLGAYDFLVLLGSLRVYPLEPERLYLRGASGPLDGARLLLGDTTSLAEELDRRCSDLARQLGVSLRAMEDAVCNWQKNPAGL